MAKNVDLPHDVTGHAIQVVSLENNPTNLGFSATAATSALPSGLAANEVCRIAATEDCYIAFGDNTVQATTDDYLFPAGVEYVKIPFGASYISALRVTTSGILSVCEVK